MRWNARGTMALLVSALVGVTAGVVVGFTTGSSPPAKAGPRRPLVQPERLGDDRTTRCGLGAPLENLDCTGDNILVVGWGANTGRPRPTPSLPTVDAEREVPRDGELLQHALRRREAGPRPSTPSTSAPSTAPSEPCALRMSIDHPRDVVTTLKRGVKIHVQCLCVGSTRRLPDAQRRHGRRHPRRHLHPRPATPARRHRPRAPRPDHRRVRPADGGDDPGAAGAQRDRPHALPAGRDRRPGRCSATAAASSTTSERRAIRACEAA